MSDDKIVSINRGDRSPAEVDAELIDRLEAILAQAKAGFVTGIAIAATTSDGGIITGIHRTVSSNAFSMLGGVAHLFQRADRELLE